MRMLAAVSLLLVSVQTALAQYYNNYLNPVENFYHQYRDTPAAENDLANAKALRDKARKEREETGKSDVGARLRLEEECSRAIERGVEEGVRRSYGCGRSSYVPPVQQQSAGPKVVYPPPSATGRTGSINSFARSDRPSVGHRPQSSSA